MEDMDLFAGMKITDLTSNNILCQPRAFSISVWVMHQHVKMPNLDPNIPLPYTFVTILVDKISFTDLVPKVTKF